MKNIILGVLTVLVSLGCQTKPASSPKQALKCPLLKCGKPHASAQVVGQYTVYDSPRIGGLALSAHSDGRHLCEFLTGDPEQVRFMIYTSKGIVDSLRFPSHEGILETEDDQELIHTDPEVIQKISCYNGMMWLKMQSQFRIKGQSSRQMGEKKLTLYREPALLFDKAMGSNRYFLMDDNYRSTGDLLCQFLGHMGMEEMVGRGGKAESTNATEYRITIDWDGRFEFKKSHAQDEVESITCFDQDT